MEILWRVEASFLSHKPLYKRKNPADEPGLDLLEHQC